MSDRPEDYGHISSAKLSPAEARRAVPAHATKPLCQICAHLDDGGEIRSVYAPEVPGAPLEARRG